MLYKQLDLRFFFPNQRLRQRARNQPPHSTATRVKRGIKKGIFHFKKFKHDFLLIMIFRRLILFWINNYHYACIKRNLCCASKQSGFFTKHGFFFEISDTEICDNQKNYLIIHNFYLILTLTIIGRNASTKKIDQTAIFLNFVIIIKYFYTKKLNCLSLKNLNTTFKL